MIFLRILRSSLPVFSFWPCSGVQYRLSFNSIVFIVRFYLQLNFCFRKILHKKRPVHCAFVSISCLNSYKIYPQFYTMNGHTYYTAWFDGLKYCSWSRAAPRVFAVKWQSSGGRLSTRCPYPIKRFLEHSGSSLVCRRIVHYFSRRSFCNLWYTLLTNATFEVWRCVSRLCSYRGQIHFPSFPWSSRLDSKVKIPECRRVHEDVMSQYASDILVA